MSIATDVSRIKGNITAALAAIADKGVTVPDGSTSDALASLIASIEAGGGGGAKIATGSFTPAEDCNHYVITHNLGEKPNLAICICKSIVKKSFSLLYDDSTQRIVRYNGDGYLNGLSEPSSSIINQTRPSDSDTIKSGMYNATENTIKAGNELMSINRFLTGTQYIWIVAVI